MRNKILNIVRRIVVMCLIIVVAVTSIPASGLTAEGKETNDSAWDGTFENEVLGKTPNSWSLFSCEMNGKLAPNKTYKDNYDLIVTDGKEKGTKALSVEAK